MRHLFLMLFLLCSLNAISQSRVEVERYIDWEERQLIFYLSTDVDTKSLPSSKQRSEGVIQRFKTSAIASNLSNFPLDNWGNFRLDSPRNTGSLSWNLEKISGKAVQDYSVFSADMRRVRTAFSLPFSALTESFLVEYRSQLPAVLVPSSQSFEFSGIVVYADMTLPSLTNGAVQEFLQPTLLPSVMSSNGQVLLSYNTVKHSSLANWGTAGYSFSSDRRDWPSDRVGKNPLIISARSLYGNNFVDAVISQTDADRILANNEGRKLLEEGRVLLVIRDPHNNADLVERMNTETQRIANGTMQNKFTS